MTSLMFAHYGEERDLICTEEERKIFQFVCEMSGRDLELVRKSDSYVSAVLGPWDVARIKYTPRAKWVIFPTVDMGSPKIRINKPEDVKEYKDKIDETIAHIEKYSTP